MHCTNGDEKRYTRASTCACICCCIRLCSTRFHSDSKFLNFCIPQRVVGCLVAKNSVLIVEASTHSNFRCQQHAAWIACCSMALERAGLMQLLNKLVHFRQLARQDHSIACFVYLRGNAKPAVGSSCDCGN